MKNKLILDQPDAGQFIRGVRKAISLIQEQFVTELSMTYNTVEPLESGTDAALSIDMEAYRTSAEGN